MFVNANQILPFFCCKINLIKNQFCWLYKKLSPYNNDITFYRIKYQEMHTFQTIFGMILKLMKFIRALENGTDFRYHSTLLNYYIAVVI